jgi:hypothetical protein
MVANKEIGGPNGFERFLKYYVKLTPTRFIEQCVTPKLYNNFLLEIFSSHVTLLNGNNDCPHFQCVYYGGEWSSKVRLYHRRSNGWPNGLIDPRTNKPIFIQVFPNVANAGLLNLCVLFLDAQSAPNKGSVDAQNKTYAHSLCLRRQ